MDVLSLIVSTRVMAAAACVLSTVAMLGTLATLLIVVTDLLKRA